MKDEASTRTEIIDKKLLKAGWDINDRAQVLLEYDIVIGLAAGVDEPRTPYSYKDAGCSSDLDYVEQTSWVLVHKYLDDLEKERMAKAERWESIMKIHLTSNIAGKFGRRPSPRRQNRSSL